MKTDDESRKLATSWNQSAYFGDVKLLNILFSNGSPDQSVYTHIGTFVRICTVVIQQYSDVSGMLDDRRVLSRFQLFDSWKKARSCFPLHDLLHAQHGVSMLFWLQLRREETFKAFSWVEKLISAQDFCGHVTYLKPLSTIGLKSMQTIINLTLHHTTGARVRHEQSYALCIMTQATMESDVAVCVQCSRWVCGLSQRIPTVIMQPRDFLLSLT